MNEKAPELYGCGSNSPAPDRFALCAALWELIVERLPVDENPRPQPCLPGVMPPRLILALLPGLSKNPVERWSKHRSEAVPGPAPKEVSAEPVQLRLALDSEQVRATLADEVETKPASRHPWAYLLQRVFAVDVLTCSLCKEAMRLVKIASTADEVARALIGGRARSSASSASSAEAPRPARLVGSPGNRRTPKDACGYAQFAQARRIQPPLGRTLL